MPTTSNRKILDDVLTFAEVGLETPVYDWQAKILGAIDKFAHSDRIKIAVSAPNGAGKSRAGGRRGHSPLAEPLPSRSGHPNLRRRQADRLPDHAGD